MFSAEGSNQAVSGNDTNEVEENEPSTNTYIDTTKVDKGWAWVVCFACFVEFAIFDGIFFTFGIVFTELTDHFQSTKEGAAWIMSLNIGTCFIVGPIVSALAHQFGFRCITIFGCTLAALGLILSAMAKNITFLYLSYGIISGFGYGMVFLCATSSVTHYFNKRRSLATGLAYCGNGVGMFIMSPVTESFIQTYTWRGAILLQAGFILNGIIFGIAFRPIVKPKQVNRQLHKIKDTRIGADTHHSITVVCCCKLLDWIHGTVLTFTQTMCNVAKETFDFSLLKKVDFAIFVVATALLSLVLYVPILYLPDLAKSVGIEEFQRAWVMSAMGISNIVSRVGFGVLSDRSWVNRLYLYSTADIVYGVVIICTPLCRTLDVLVVISVLHGVFQGLLTILMSVLVADLVGVEKYSQGFGLLNFISAIATIVGPPAAGWVYDQNGSYLMTFYLCGSITCVSGVIMLAIPCIHSIKQRSQVKHMSE